ncbi:xylose-binding protein [Clostridium cavendishii DSM 21758]|uniref:Xylose-binding protein n=1 Tax=Clostridium cavendishii DSM 21758 TaxID=1121302 RepID=A0A1M6D383_9CLOT|nr:substrate-binding domain-containing protein [Clostridium cavendishii]SHI67458.1 xylose-binding protein [Clostridium cavendishii DSM 21758]
MYLSIPAVFFVPVYYEKENMLNIIIGEFNLNNEFSDRKDITIGISLPTQREEKWIREKDYMEEYSKNKGVKVIIENADTDSNKQALQVDNLISQGIDILILAPVDSVAAKDIVEKAHKAGIKVIDYDRLIKNSDVDLLVNFNKTRIGELQGKFVTQNVPKGNYIIMSGDPRDDNSYYIKNGAMAYIKPLADKGEINIIADKAVDNWEPQNAFKIVEEALRNNNNKVDAIVAPNDATAGAAIEALKKQGLDGKVVVTGQDGDLAAIQRIIKRTQSMTVLKDTREIVAAAIDAAIKLVRGEAVDTNAKVNNGKIDVPAIIIAPISIDKNNLKSVLIDSGYLKQNEVFEVYR